MTDISIHALLAESDCDDVMRMILAAIFLSTLSLRRATNSLCLLLLSVIFLSTLSLRRATRPGLTRYYPGRIFYPRSPCGERHSLNLPSSPIDNFLSTLSLRRATFGRFQFWVLSNFSIHALLAESDRGWTLNINGPMIFLSTLSLRRATLRVVDGSKSSIFSIHALLAESDSKSAQNSGALLHI